MICPSCSKPLTPCDDKGIRGWACLTCHHKDGSYSTKDIDRMQIAMDTEAWQAQGNVIKEVDHTANHSFRQPVKRKRKEQYKYLKRLTNMRGISS